MSIESLIFNYERALSADSRESYETRVLSSRISIDDFCFIQAISDFYRTTRSSVVQELLSESLREFFDKLPESSRLSIATATQDLYIMEEKKTFEEQCPGLSFKFSGRSTSWFAIANYMSGNKLEINTDE